MHVSRLMIACLPLLATAPASAQGAAVTSAQPASPPVQLTIYNGDFAVARTTVDLDLKRGITEVLATNVTRALEPDSVVLRDPTGHNTFRVLEQNYDASVIDQASLLRSFEGKTIDFSVSGNLQSPAFVKGHIIRAGGLRNIQNQYGYSNVSTEPLIEVDGRMLFRLPGTPVFPASVAGLLLKPTLRWQIESVKPAHFIAEFAYITRDLSWQATYNVVAPETGDVTGEEHADLHGWVTIGNHSGTDFPAAGVKLMAGDVAKLRDTPERYQAVRRSTMEMNASVASVGVTQKAFDDFHLYDLHRTVSLPDGETKQVEFLTVPNVSMRRIYEYDGASQVQASFNQGYGNTQQNFGLGDETTVAIREEIKNSEANHLGMPLPAGRIRFYRRDSDRQMEFVGEGTIRHTPAEGTVSLTTGNAFDVKGKRTQTAFHVEGNGQTIDESFAIDLTNQKAQPVTVVVVEHLYRAANSTITAKSSELRQVDSHTVEFPITVPPRGESKLTYTVHYSW